MLLGLLLGFLLAGVLDLVDGLDLAFFDGDFVRLLLVFAAPLAFVDFVFFFLATIRAPTAPNGRLTIELYSQRLHHTSNTS